MRSKPKATEEIMHLKSLAALTTIALVSWAVAPTPGQAVLMVWEFQGTVTHSTSDFDTISGGFTYGTEPADLPAGAPLPADASSDLEKGQYETEESFPWISFSATLTGVSEATYSFSLLPDYVYQGVTLWNQSSTTDGFRYDKFQVEGETSGVGQESSFRLWSWLDDGAFSGASLEEQATWVATEGYSSQGSVENDDLGTVSFTLDYLGPVRVAGGGSSPVPEPSTMLFLGSGLIGLSGFARRKIGR